MKYWHAHILYNFSICKSLIQYNDGQIIYDPTKTNCFSFVIDNIRKSIRQIMINLDLLSIFFSVSPGSVGLVLLPATSCEASSGTITFFFHMHATFSF